MKTVKLPVQRFYSIPGIGAKVLNEIAEVQQAENAEELLELFVGTEEQKWKEVIDACNRLKRAQARSSIIESKGGSDPKSTISLVKKAIPVFQNLFPNKSKSEIAQMVVTDELRTKLEAEGVEFGDSKELRAKYKEEIGSDETSEEETE